MRKARRWDRTSSKRSARESVWDKWLREFYPRADRPQRRPHDAPRPAAKARRQSFALESLEPRLLMSADLSYTPAASNPTATVFWLEATGSNTVGLFDAQSGGNQVGHATMTDGQLTVQRSIPGIPLSNKIHLDADTFSTLNAGASGITGNSSTLSITYNGGDQTLFHDAVTLDNTATLPFGLSVTSNTPISSSAHIAVQGNLTLESSYTLNNGAVGTGLLANDNTGITLSGANLSTTTGGTGDTLTLEAISNLSVSTDGSHTGAPSADTSLDSVAQTLLSNNLGSFAASHGLSLITSYNNAAVSVGGSSVLDSAGDLDITSMVEGSLTGTASGSPIHVNIAVLAGSADPSVAITGSDLTAGGKIDVTATTANSGTPFTISNTTPMASNQNSSSDTSADGAVAVTVFDSEALLSVAGSSDLSATGAVMLSANSALMATTTGNASGGTSAGAGVAVTAIYGDTMAYVDGSTVDGSSVTVAASSARTISTTADASSQGSSSSGGMMMNPSENTLQNNNASASDGAGGASSISVAGAVAVNVDTGTTQAYINNGTIGGAGAGSVTVSTTPIDSVTSTADGEFTGMSGQGTGVGVGVAINVADRNNYADITGTTSITAGSISVEVMPPMVMGASGFSASATSGFGSTNTGIAGSLAINVVSVDNEASIGTGTTGAAVKLTGTGSGTPNLTVEADSNIANTATAMPSSGGGMAGDVGIGASIAINYGQNSTLAYIESGATVTGANNLMLTASSQNAMATTAMNGAASTGTSVTPVIAVSVADDTTAATLGAGGTGGMLTIGGDFQASSSLTDSVQTTATGNTTASKVGVGISIALSIVNDSSQATTTGNLVAGGAAAFLSSAISGSESNASASTAGDSDSDNSGGSSGVDKQTTNQKNVAGNMASEDEGKVKTQEGSADSNEKAPMGTGSDSSPSASTSDGGVDVAGAVAVNIENGSSRADIPDGVMVTATGTVTVRSQANVDGHAISSGSATTTGSGISVGVGVSVNVNNPTNLAYIGNGATISSGGLLVGATMADRQVDPMAVATPVVTVDGATPSPFAADSIFLGLNSGLKTGDKVKYNAESHTAVGGLKDGDSYYVNVASTGAVQFWDASNSNAQSDAQSGNTMAAEFATLKSGATGSEQEFYKYVMVPMVGNEPDLLNPIKFNPTGDVTLLNPGNSSEFRTGDPVSYDAMGGTPITGLDGTGGNTYYLIDLTGGYYQLASTQQDAFAGNAISLTGSSNIGNTNQRLHDDTDSSLATAMSGASGGNIGVAGSVAVNLVNNNTQAVVGLTPGETGPSTTHITITGAGNVSVTAGGLPAGVPAAPSLPSQVNYALATPAPGNTGGGKVGVGASVAVNVVGASQNLVNAQIADGTSFINTIGTLTVSAIGNDGAYTHGENGASGGGVEIGVGAAVAVLQDTVTAYVGTGGIITGSGAVNITAALTTHFTTETDAKAAASSVGVGASVSVAVVSDNVSANVARDIDDDRRSVQPVLDLDRVESDAEAIASVSGEDSSGKDSGGKSQSSADGQASQQQGNATMAGAKSSTLPSAGGEASSSESTSSTNGGDTSSGGGSGKGGGDSSGVGVAAAVSVNVLTANNTAEITDGADITASRRGDDRGAGPGQRVGQGDRRGGGDEQQCQYRRRRRLERGQCQQQGVCRHRRVGCAGQRDHDQGDHAGLDHRQFHRLGRRRGRRQGRSSDRRVGRHQRRHRDHRSFGAQRIASAIERRHQRHGDRRSQHADPGRGRGLLARRERDRRDGDGGGPHSDDDGRYRRQRRCRRRDLDRCREPPLPVENCRPPGPHFGRPSGDLAGGRRCGEQRRRRHRGLVHRQRLHPRCHRRYRRRAAKSTWAGSTPRQPARRSRSRRYNETEITTIAGAFGLTSGDAGVGVGLDVEILNKDTQGLYRRLRAGRCGRCGQHHGHIHRDHAVDRSDLGRRRRSRRRCLDIGRRHQPHDRRLYRRLGEA